jgi:uncharacterized protein involved in exopolysaccharide biosynthesis
MAPVRSAYHTALMSTPRYPSIEFVQRPGEATALAPPRGARWKIFCAVFVLAAGLGAAIVYARPTIYRASVSVVTVKPKAVDQPSAQADPQHVAIQERLLLGDDVLARLAERLRAAGDAPFAQPAALRDLLAVAAVPETNLVELRAQGEDPARLRRVVSAWGGAYQAFRLDEIEKASGRTSAELEAEQRELRARIDAAQAELLAFKQANDIVSLERGENRSLAGLKGLNDSLNKARERLIDARARKAAIDEAFARGETLVPDEQKAEVSKLRVQATRLRSRLAELRQKYTDVLLARDPAYRDLPAELDELEKVLETTLAVGRERVREDAQQALESARLSVAALERELQDGQSQVQLFTDRFEQYTALEDGLARLQRLAAERGERLAQIEIRNQQAFPPIELVDSGEAAVMRIAPDYERDLMIALTASLLLALFVTWLVEYLGGRTGGAAAVPVFGVRISSPDLDALPAAAAAPSRISHDPAHWHALPGAPGPLRAPGAGHQTLRELTLDEVEAVLDRLHPVTGAFATLLLSGIAPYELAILDGDCFDRRMQRVSVRGANRREIVLDSDAWQRVEPLLTQPHQVRASILAELDLQLGTAAHAAGVAQPHDVSAFTLWLCYAAHLVRQGIDEAALSRRVGALPAHVRGMLAPLAPGAETAAVHPAVIEYTHPALRQ